MGGGRGREKSEGGGKGRELGWVWEMGGSDARLYTGGWV